MFSINGSPMIFKRTASSLGELSRKSSSCDTMNRSGTVAWKSNETRFGKARGGGSSGDSEWAGSSTASITRVRKSGYGPGAACENPSMQDVRVRLRDLIRLQREERSVKVLTEPTEPTVMSRADPFARLRRVFV